LIESSNFKVTTLDENSLYNPSIDLLSSHSIDKDYKNKEINSSHSPINNKADDSNSKELTTKDLTPNKYSFKKRENKTSSNPLSTKPGSKINTETSPIDGIKSQQNKEGLDQTKQSNQNNNNNQNNVVLEERNSIPNDENLDFINTLLKLKSAATNKKIPVNKNNNQNNIHIQNSNSNQNYQEDYNVSNSKQKISLSSDMKETKITNSNMNSATNVINVSNSNNAFKVVNVSNTINASNLVNESHASNTSVLQENKYFKLFSTNNPQEHTLNSSNIINSSNINSSNILYLDNSQFNNKNPVKDFDLVEITNYKKSSQKDVTTQDGYFRRRHLETVKRTERFKKEREEKELEELSFKPKISQKSKNIMNKLSSSKNMGYNIDDAFKKNKRNCSVLSDGIPSNVNLISNIDEINNNIQNSKCNNSNYREYKDVKSNSNKNSNKSCDKILTIDKLNDNKEHNFNNNLYIDKNLHNVSSLKESTASNSNINKNINKNAKENKTNFQSNFTTNNTNNQANINSSGKKSGVSSYYNNYLGQKKNNMNTGNTGNTGNDKKVSQLHDYNSNNLDHVNHQFNTNNTNNHNQYINDNNENQYSSNIGKMAIDSKHFDVSGDIVNIGPKSKTKPTDYKIEFSNLNTNGDYKGTDTLDSMGKNFKFSGISNNHNYNNYNEPVEVFKIVENNSKISKDFNNDKAPFIQEKINNINNINNSDNFNNINSINNMNNVNNVNAMNEDLSDYNDVEKVEIDLFACDEPEQPEKQEEKTILSNKNTNNQNINQRSNKKSSEASAKFYVPDSKDIISLQTNSNNIYNNNSNNKSINNSKNYNIESKNTFSIYDMHNSKESKESKELKESISNKNSIQMFPVIENAEFKVEYVIDNNKSVSASDYDTKLKINNNKNNNFKSYNNAESIDSFYYNHQNKNANINSESVNIPNMPKNIAEEGNLTGNINQQRDTNNSYLTMNFSKLTNFPFTGVGNSNNYSMLTNNKSNNNITALNKSNIYKDYLKTKENILNDNKYKHTDTYETNISNKNMMLSYLSDSKSNNYNNTSTNEKLDDITIIRNSPNTKKLNSVIEENSNFKNTDRDSAIQAEISLFDNSYKNDRNDGTGTGKSKPKLYTPQVNNNNNNKDNKELKKLNYFELDESMFNTKKDNNKIHIMESSLEEEEINDEKNEFPIAYLVQKKDSNKSNKVLSKGTDMINYDDIKPKNTIKILNGDTKLKSNPFIKTKATSSTKGVTDVKHSMNNESVTSNSHINNKSSDLNESNTVSVGNSDKKVGNKNVVSTTNKKVVSSKDINTNTKNTNQVNNNISNNKSKINTNNSKTNNNTNNNTNSINNKNNMNTKQNTKPIINTTNKKNTSDKDLEEVDNYDIKLLTQQGEEILQSLSNGTFLESQSLHSNKNIATTQNITNNSNNTGNNLYDYSNFSLNIIKNSQDAKKYNAMNDMIYNNIKQTSKYNYINLILIN